MRVEVFPLTVKDKRGVKKFLLNFLTPPTTLVFTAESRHFATAFTRIQTRSRAKSTKIAVKCRIPDRHFTGAVKNIEFFYSPVTFLNYMPICRRDRHHIRLCHPSPVCGDGGAILPVRHHALQYSSDRSCRYISLPGWRTACNTRRALP